MTGVGACRAASGATAADQFSALPLAGPREWCCSTGPYQVRCTHERFGELTASSPPHPSSWATYGSPTRS
jgi:hypothetical protein